MFNAWDYVCPMIQDDIGEIMSYVAPALEKVQNVHRIIQKLSEKVPNQTKMKEAISQMEMHLGAAAKISATLDFTRGFGDTDCVSTVNIPTLEPTDPEPGKRCLRSDTSTTQDSTTPATTTVPSRTTPATMSTTATVGTTTTTTTTTTTSAVATTSTASAATSKINLRPHCRIGKFQCPCGLVFPNSSQWKTHMNAIHKKTWECSSCDKLFKT